MLNLHKQQSISHIAQSPHLALQKEMITAWALIRPTAAGSRWRSSPDICVEIAEPIIARLRLLLRFHFMRTFDLQRYLLGKQYPAQPILLNSPGGGSSADIN